MSYSWGSKCTVSYSADKKNWIEAESYDQYSDNGTKTIAFPAPGNYYLRLDVNAISYFDDFQIVKLTSTGIAQIGNWESENRKSENRKSENRKSENRKYFDLQGRPVTNVQWSTVNGQWSTANGQLIIVDGKKVLRK